jgi:hypothetical protein
MVISGQGIGAETFNVSDQRTTQEKQKSVNRHNIFLFQTLEDRGNYSISKADL